MLSSKDHNTPQNVDSIKKTLRPNNIYRHLPELTSEELAILSEMFPCNDPYTRSMSSFFDRQVTYHRNWPGHINATMRELADAGFFYLGTGDKLKCYYCNGGLQNWQKEENPWFEHAKWFPNCEYLLRRKGINYVEHVGSLFPNLKRPNPNNSSRTQQNLGFPKTSTPPSPSSFLPSSHSIPSSSSLPGILVADDAASSSSSGEMKPLKKSLKEAMESFIVKQAIAMAFDEDIVRNVVQKKLIEKNEEYTTMSDLVNDLLTIEEETPVEEAPADVYSLKANNSRPSSLEIPHSSLRQSPSIKSIQNTTLNSVGSETDKNEYFHSSETPEEVIQSLLDERTCKVCLDRSINCVFQPCGHVCCCLECSSAVTKCPICRQVLTRIVKFYR